jgi:hypothetical protein
VSQYVVYTYMFLTRVGVSMVRGCSLLGRHGQLCCGREGVVRPAWSLPSRPKTKLSVWTCSRAEKGKPARGCSVQCSVFTDGGTSPPIDVLVMVEATAQQVRCAKPLSMNICLPVLQVVCRFAISSRVHVIESVVPQIVKDVHPLSCA